MLLGNLRLVWRAVRQTGLLGQNPWRAFAVFLACHWRFGASLYTLAAWAAWRYSSQTALVSDTQGDIKSAAERFSYAALLEEVNGVAVRLNTAFEASRVRTVAIMCRNHAMHVQALLACSRLGVDVLLLGTRLTAQQLQEISSGTRIDALICDAEFEARGQHLGALVIRAERSSFEALPKSDQGIPRRRTGSIVILTSGSTGPAKLIRRRPTLNQLLRTCAYLLEQVRVRTGNPTLLTVPLSHGYGLATLGLSLVTGSTLHMFARSDTHSFLRCITSERIRVLLLVPTILYRLLEQLRQAPESLDTSSIQTIISGSAPLDPNLATRALNQFGDVLFNLYGSSEAGLIALATPHDLRVAPGCVGKPLPSVNVRLLEPRGAVCVQGDLALKRIWNTGDIGRFDAAGRLFLLGRQDDLLICGGENVYPETLERTINQLEGVIESAVIGVPDVEFGQAIKLFIVLKPTVKLEVIERELQTRFPRALRPKQIVHVLELPRNAVGKLQRQRLELMAERDSAVKN